MISDLCLHLGGTFFSFFLQITAAYFACSLLVRSLTAPRPRFRVWVGLLAGSAMYWVGIVAWQIGSWAFRSHVPVNASSNSLVTSPSFLIPFSWGPGVQIAGRVLLTAYLATVICFLIVNVYRQVRLWKLLRQGWRPSEEISLLFEEVRRERGISRCGLLVLPSLATPATAGWLRPCVLLPPVCEDLEPNTRLADVLHHELAHVARRDYFWAGLADLICSLLFFHPAVWHARKMARFQGELACDLAVVEACPDRRVDYADSLAYFVRLRMIQEQAALGIDFASAPSSLGMRIRLILAGAPILPWWKRLPRKAGALAIIAGFAAGAPALTVSFGFLLPTPEVAQQQSPLAAAPYVRRPHFVAAPQTHPLLLPVTDLSKLRVGTQSAYARPYSLNRADGSGRGDLSRGLEAPWRETASSRGHPSVADVIGSAVAIAVSHPDHDHDKDEKHFTER